MANPLSTDDAVYFTNFLTGNEATPSTYTEYPNDFDTNFLSIRASLNAVIAEVSAIGGPNAVVSIDIVTADDEGAEVTLGLLGAHSYTAVVNGVNVDVEGGVALIPDRVKLVGQVNLTHAAGGSGTKFIALDINGVPFLEDSAAQQVLDIWTVDWDGSVFTAATEVRLVEIFPDGDDLIAAHKRAANGGWAAKTSLNAQFLGIAPRLQAIESAITGFDTDSEGDAVSTLGVAGDETNPGIVMTDGTSTRDTTTGWYRSALDQWAFAVTSTLAVLLGSFGLRLLNGSAATPAVSGISDTNAGLFWEQTPDLLGIAVDGSAVMTVGAAAALALRIDAAGQIDLPTQFRFRAVNASESIADGIALKDVLIQDAEEIYDIGGWHSGSSADHVVPTDGDGTYEVKLNAVWAASATGQRSIAIEHESVDYGLVLVDASAVGVTGISTSIELDAVATDVFKIRAGQASGGGALVSAFEFSIRKVA